MKKRDIEREALSLASQLISDDCTIRRLSKRSGIPRMTVYNRLAVDLKGYDVDLWLQCRNILLRHKEEAVSRMNAARLQHKESL